MFLFSACPRGMVMPIRCTSATTKRAARRRLSLRGSNLLPAGLNGVELDQPAAPEIAEVSTSRTFDEIDGEF